TAATAMNTVAPADRDRRPEVPLPAAPTPPLPDAVRARAWLDVELPNLLAAVRYAAEHGLPGHAVHLSAILHLHFRVHRNYAEAEALHRHALTAARASGDRVGAAGA